MRSRDCHQRGALRAELVIHRRHLSATQLAFVALRVEEVEAERAKERMAAGGAIGGASKGAEKIPQPLEDTGRARDIAAKAVGERADKGEAAKIAAAKVGANHRRVAVTKIA